MAWRGTIRHNGEEERSQHPRQNGTQDEARHCGALTQKPDSHSALPKANNFFGLSNATLVLRVWSSNTFQAVIIIVSAAVAVQPPSSRADC